jgi:hypothetical protein
VPYFSTNNQRFRSKNLSTNGSCSILKRIRSLYVVCFFDLVLRNRVRPKFKWFKIQLHLRDRRLCCYEVIKIPGCSKQLLERKRCFTLKACILNFFVLHLRKLFSLCLPQLCPTTLTKENANLLQMLQRAVDNGTHTKLPDAHYSCFEFAALEEPVLPGCVYRKKDVSGQGKGLRTQNRVIIPMNTATNKVVEGVAYYWRHDNRVMKLSAEYFKHAETYRYM